MEDNLVNPSMLAPEVLRSINLVPFVFLAILLVLAKLAPRKSFHEDYTSLESTKNLQGFSMLFIIFHHLVQLISSYGWFNIGPVTIFNQLGLVFTGVFFFCSGFGLVTSVEKKENYLKTFLYRRLPSIVIPFYTASTLYILLVHYVWKSFPWPKNYAWQAFSGWKLYNNHLWFPIEIVFIYIAFFIIFTILKNHKNIAMALLSLFVVGMILFTLSQGRDNDGFNDAWFHGEWWCNSTLLFIVGMYYAKFLKPITNFFKKFYVAVLPVVIVLFGGSLILAGKLNADYGYTPDFSNKILWKESIITLLGDSIKTLLFILLFLLISMKVKFNNPVLRFFGMISFELYMTHNIILYYFFNKLEMNHNIQLIIYVYGLSIVLAFVVHMLNKVLLLPFKGKRATARV